MLFRFFWLALLAFAPPLLAQEEAVRYSDNPVLATVDGRPVVLEDLRNKRIHDLTLQLHQELEAELLEYSVRELAKTHEEIRPEAEITLTDADLKRFYDASGLKSRGTFEQLAPQIRGFMEQQLRMEHLQSQYALALQEGWVQSYLAPPSDFVITASVKTAYLRGNESAGVMLLEFSDYQCPFCLRVQETLENLLREYGEQVVFGYRHFPLTFHTEADEAAVAAECAREQGKFEVLHKILYQRQKAQSVNNLKTYGREIQIKNLEAYDRCIEEDRYRKLVDQDIEDGMALGITGTPGFIIGAYDPKTRTVRGELLSGAQPYQKFVEVLEKYLKPKS